jgi:uncharacterized peroxidase-related enzyme
MPWIDVIRPEAASGELADLYRAIAGARGGVADVHQVQSLNPRAMATHLELYKAIVFQRSTLSRRDRERIGVVVSAANGCGYCVAHHGQALRNLGEAAAVAEALEAGAIPEAGLTAGERALLAWAARGARAPAEATAADLDALRAAGYDDRALLDAALTVGYFAFVNRLVLLLGVDLEEGYERTCAPDMAAPSDGRPEAAPA